MANKLPEITTYNSLTKQKEVIVPHEGNKIRMYACGPTVYDSAHLGHARSAVSFDIVQRFLRHVGYDVTFVRNYTDVDDKIINRANELGVSPTEISERYISACEAFNPAGHHLEHQVQLKQTVVFQVLLHA